MNLSSKNELIDNLYKIGAIKIEEVVLRSGDRSPIYIDLRKVNSYLALRRSMCLSMWSMICDIQFDHICGVPLTGIPFATMISDNHDVRMLLSRRETKTYGTKSNQIGGEFKSGEIVMVCEDIITSGSSIMETIESLKSVGLVVEFVCVFVDREQKGVENLSKKGIKVRSLMKISDILNRLVEKEIMKEDERIKITDWLEENPCELSIE
ncbi:uncharacterized protein LOC128385810 [Panonychus citri]|uniref:uncharacterized protein LOC128385810 n=1 Tax=Panonychus citri TaxID=50023 RepID=UPI0023077DBD|nr:uncharacterized protein LOC128385810 [Panonychus citri]